jgi:Domain of unknown function (DUF4105)
VTAAGVGLLAAWGFFALLYQLPGGKLGRRCGAAVWALFAVVAVILGHLLMFVVVFVVLVGWWVRIKPSNDRDWAEDLARMTTGVVTGEQVTLNNVRHFDWRTRTDYTQCWETRTYDLGRLSSVDLVLSYWSLPAIAHVLISFGFADGDHVVFSVEIRREKTESFSKVGGFFKEFELSILACDERDVIRLRTNVRGEDVYLYRIRMQPDTMRSLFLAYVEQANQLAQTPRFYNTITVNCTTLVYQMMRRIVGRLPLDIRLLLSGYLPGYAYKVGGLDSRHSLAELRALGRVTQRARQSDRRPTFSADIRAGVPPLEM